MKKYHIDYEMHMPSLDCEKTDDTLCEVEYGDVSEGRLLEAITAILADPVRDNVIITRCNDEH